MHQQVSLLFASHNRHKVEEVRLIIPDRFRVEDLDDIGLSEDIPEPYDTFEANACGKAAYVYTKTGIPCFADDSGLEVDALGGRPGVLSARYAGPGRSSADNVKRVLEELGNSEDRSARFVAVLAFQYAPKTVNVFRGVVEGRISHGVEGIGGFGYDPIFIPAGFDQSFGVLPAALKNRISHRAIAIGKFAAFLQGHPIDLL